MPRDIGRRCALAQLTMLAIVMTGAAMGEVFAQTLKTVHPSRVGLDPARLDVMDAHFQAKADAGVRSGYVIMVARAGKIAHLSTIGLSDRENRRPMRRDTRFRIGSMTKPIISAAVMKLVEDGKLQLFDPVSLYLPEYADMTVAVAIDADGDVATEPLQRPLTVFDLITHTSGLGAAGKPDLPGSSLYAARYPAYFGLPSLDAASRWAAEIPLVFQPGEMWGYGFSLDALARIIEVVAGEPIEKVLERLIFEPLDMRNTYFNGRSADRTNLAVMYASDAEGGLAPLSSDSFMLDQLQFPLAGGGLISTVDDYMKFAQMMLNRGAFAGKRILSPASVDAMTRNVLPDDLLPIDIGVPTFNAGFGLGVAVVVDAPFSQSLLAEGDYFWASATDGIFFVSPKRNMIGVILSQYWGNEHTAEWRTWHDFASLLSAAVSE